MSVLPTPPKFLGVKMVIKHLKVNRLNETKVGLKQKKERGASDLTLSQDFLLRKRESQKKLR